MVGVALVPMLAFALALSKAAHDLPRLVARGPEPIAGLCQTATSYTLSPMAHASYVGLGGLAIGAIALGSLSLVLTLARTRRRLDGLLASRCEMPEAVRDIFDRSGLKRGVLIRSNEAGAFTYGYIHPQVALTTGLVERLSGEELQAVLLHEAAHVSRFDPLRMLVVTMVSRTFFFAPALLELAHQFQTAKEIDADDYAVTVMQTRKHLAAALLQVEEVNSRAMIVGFDELLDARIASLEGEEPFTPSSHALLGRVVTVTAVLGVTLGLFFITTGAVDAHVLHVCA